MDDANEGASLSAKIEVFAGTADQAQNAARRGLRNLFILLYPRHGDTPLIDNQQFVHTLSPRQRHAAALLAEWWTREQDAELVDVVKPHIFALALFRPEGDMSIPMNGTEVLDIEQFACDDDREILNAVGQRLANDQGELYRKTQARMHRIYSGIGTFGTQASFYGSIHHQNMLILFDWELIRLEDSVELSFITQRAAKTSAAAGLGFTFSVSQDPRLSH
ncbi:hypothetical protein PG993_014070 [Apiospora rasikravindrae]|uniref:Uncharacterized protein n=1 Tax=Apiospora rasikravindrae TaxID=990691 RepID=A0ABR1RRY3_9PEZI